MRRILTVASALLVIPTALHAQHDHAHSPYADLTVDDATTIPADEVTQLRAGEGMGLALVAELNQYPGPKHVVELAEPLGLDEEQIHAIEAIRDEMTQEAVAKGSEVLDAESELTKLFRAGALNQSQVAEWTLRIGRLRAELRAIHLGAHLTTRRLLSPEQIRAYDLHRGYS